MRIHITGASGAGVTTLGAALASALAVPHHDTDDFYWAPTNPPFQTKRPVSERIELMRQMFLPRPGWVLSGSLDSWATELIPSFDRVVFVQTDTALRLARLRERETRRGRAAGVQVQGFLDWAASYEQGPDVGRSRSRHEAWLQTLPCPVLRLEGSQPVAGLVAQVLGRDAADPGGFGRS